LENLPESLHKLDFYENQITKLENLPESLKVLKCRYNRITKLENLPNTLQELNCSGNQITKLENLPESLCELDYSKNPIQFVDDVEYNRIEFSLKGYQAIRRIQKRMKRRFKMKNEASRLIGKRVLHLLYKVDGIMCKKGWENLVNEGIINI
jgi:Leucine-rich repeat (LRR) protein